ncbi:MAG: hypothetical protein Q8K86_05850 [Candidatus Nanopelagicaceae bacterium]|nr:hypothetical protein [Candidatus Nanopelagicaceae bacterium]
MLFGTNPFAELLLSLLDLKPGDVGRFRDCYVSEDGKRIVVFTRNGGGNREDYENVISQLQKHPAYVKDYDDDFDCTYASFEFNVPEEHKDFAELMLGLTQNKKPPMQKFEDLIEKMQTDSKHPDVQKIIEKMAPVMEQLKKVFSKEEGVRFLEL